MFGDGHVKIVCNLELEMVGHWFISFEVEKYFYKTLFCAPKGFRLLKTNKKWRIYGVKK
jgi:hypothetical protein